MQTDVRKYIIVHARRHTFAIEQDKVEVSTARGLASTGEQHSESATLTHTEDISLQGVEGEEEHEEVHLYRFVQSLVDDILPTSQRLDERERPTSEMEQEILTRTMLYKGFRVGWLFYLRQYKQLGDMVTTLLDELDRQDNSPHAPTTPSSDTELRVLRNSLRRVLSTR
ncbi:hypothetical protein C8T65DRAFT_832779 [Cerioporus squamosus]|nr:hypothetical protein C8T65DRAFT_832779 [Cerioporus squamosus]